MKTLLCNYALLAWPLKLTPLTPAEATLGGVGARLLGTGIEKQAQAVCFAVLCGPVERRVTSALAVASRAADALGCADRDFAVRGVRVGSKLPGKSFGLRLSARGLR